MILSATYYECIFKAPIIKIGTTNFPATYSIEQSCESYSPPISVCVSHNAYVDIEDTHTDPMTDILEKCNGHRLAVANGRNYSYPTIVNKQHIFAELYNTLKYIIDLEISARKLSKKYDNLDVQSILSAESKTHILKEQLADLNTLLSNLKLYYDTAKKPTLTIDSQTIQSTDINKSITAIRSIANDCICYSDCNGYSVCWCYGNCNHY